MKQPVPRLRLACLLIGIALVLAGCSFSGSSQSSTGTPIDPAKVSQIVKGTTTRAEIEAWFGKPDMTTLLPDGRRSLSYSYTSTRAETSTGKFIPYPFLTGDMTAKQRANVSTHTQNLQVFVSKDGIVEDHEFNDQIRDTETKGLNTQSTTRTP